MRGELSGVAFVSITTTIAEVNDAGEMQCTGCDRTFGRARSFARRLEAGDRWADPFVQDQVDEVTRHYREEHAIEATEGTWTN